MIIANGTNVVTNTLHDMVEYLHACHDETSFTVINAATNTQPCCTSGDAASNNDYLHSCYLQVIGALYNGVYNRCNSIVQVEDPNNDNDMVIIVTY